MSTEIKISNYTKYTNNFNPEQQYEMISVLRQYYTTSAIPRELLFIISPLDIDVDLTRFNYIYFAQLLAHFLRTMDKAGIKIKKHNGAATVRLEIKQ